MSANSVLHWICRNVTSRPCTPKSSAGSSTFGIVYRMMWGSRWDNGIYIINIPDDLPDEVAIRRWKQAQETIFLEILTTGYQILVRVISYKRIESTRLFWMDQPRNVKDAQKSLLQYQMIFQGTNHSSSLWNHQLADGQFTVHVSILSAQDFKINFETRMDSRRMRTAHSLPCGGSPWERPPCGQRSPCWQRPPRGQRPPLWTETPPMNRITDRCKNITFPKLRLRAVTKCSRIYKLYEQRWRQVICHIESVHT